MTVRVLHHIKALSDALLELRRITAPRGIYVTEFANKRNLKAIARYVMRRGKSGENPFTKEPTVFKAKPARKVVKARPVKAVKDAVL